MVDSIHVLATGVGSTFFILGTITIVLRIYSRHFVVKSFDWDDWCMLSILLFNCGQQAILYYFLQNGAGLHVMKVLTQHPEWMSNLLHALFAEEIMYSWMHFIIKMAFLLFYLRFATKRFRKLVYCTMAINIVFTLIILLLYCFQCMPLDAFFNPALHPNVKCVHNSVLAFVPAAFSIFLDVVIVVLPIQSLWAIQVSMRKRLMLISIISLGGVVVMISCVRLVVLLEFQEKNADFTWVLGKLIIISSIELEVAIMAANAPSLKILITQRLGPKATDNRKSYSNDASSTSRSQKRKSKFNGGASYIVDCVPMSPTTPKESERGIQSDSEENLWKRDSAIIVTSSVGVETHSLDLQGVATPQATKVYSDQFDAV